MKRTANQPQVLQVRCTKTWHNQGLIDTLCYQCPAFTNLTLAASPIARSRAMRSNKLVRRSYWLDMNDRSLVMVMTNGIGAHLTNDEKRAHLIDLKREHLIDQVCIQEILPPEKE